MRIFFQVEGAAQAGRDEKADASIPVPALAEASLPSSGSHQGAEPPATAPEEAEALHGSDLDQIPLPAAAATEASSVMPGSLPLAAPPPPTTPAAAAAAAQNLQEPSGSKATSGDRPAQPAVAEKIDKHAKEQLPNKVLRAAMPR
jgi:hypothetical protein